MSTFQFIKIYITNKNNVFTVTDKGSNNKLKQQAATKDSNEQNDAKNQLQQPDIHRLALATSCYMHIRFIRKLFKKNKCMHN